MTNTTLPDMAVPESFDELQREYPQVRRDLFDQANPLQGVAMSLMYLHLLIDGVVVIDTVVDTAPVAADEAEETEDAFRQFAVTNKSQNQAVAAMAAVVGLYLACPDGARFAAALPKFAAALRRILGDDLAVVAGSAVTTDRSFRFVGNVCTLRRKIVRPN